MRTSTRRIIAIAGLVGSFVGVLWSLRVFTMLSPYYILGNPISYEPWSPKELYMVIAPSSTALFPMFLGLVLLETYPLVRFSSYVALAIAAAPFLFLAPVVPIVANVPHCGFFSVYFESVVRYLAGNGLAFLPGPNCQLWASSQ